MRVQIGVYARISFDWEGKSLGVTRQKEDGAKLADLRGWHVADYYPDNNISAYKRGVVRPEFERLLSDLKSGAINGIIAYDLDRIARKPSDLERLIEIYQEHQGLVFATVQGDIDLSTSDGIAMARVMVAFANKASMDTSRRGKRKNLQRAEEGLPHGSRRPYGYNDDQMTLHAVEAPIVRQMGMKFLAGESYRSIADWLEGEGIKTTLGRPWFPITVRNSLARPRYAALRIYEGKTYSGVWEAIFTRDEWNSIQHLIRKRREEAGHLPVAKKYLLTGFLTCGKCGGYLNGQTKRDKPDRPLRRTYACIASDIARNGRRGCGGVVRNADALEHFIRELVCFRLDSPDMAVLLEADDKSQRLSELLNEQSSLDERMNEMVDSYADGTLKKDAFTRAESRLKERMRSVQDEVDSIRIARINVALKAGETVKQAWVERPDSWKRDIVGALVASIVVNVGKTKPFYDIDGVRARFDPQLIDVKWIA